MADGSIGGRDLADGSVRGTDVAAGELTGREVRDGSLEAKDLAAGELPPRSDAFKNFDPSGRVRLGDRRTSVVSLDLPSGN